MAWSGSFSQSQPLELGKKSDEYNSMNGAHAGSAWAARKAKPSWRRRRTAYVLCGLLAIYLIFKNLQGSKLAKETVVRGSYDQHPPVRVAGSARQHPAERTRKPSREHKDDSLLGKKPPRPKATAKYTDEHYHNGPIRFYKLSATLYEAASLNGQLDKNRNILFAAGSIKSLSTIIPMACEMAQWGKNDVHLTFMGREDMELSEMQEIHGVSKQDCNIHWHDARPDFAIWSTNERMEVSVRGAFDHFHQFLHPQAIIVDGPAREHKFFTQSVKDRAAEHEISLIELSYDAIPKLMWISRLDSMALSFWNQIAIDIVIQAPRQHSASVVRLLQSIQQADYFGLQKPQVTVELPADVNADLEEYLSELRWPPPDDPQQQWTSKLTQRHRIRRKTTSPEEASARLVESFYPQDPATSHVLLLAAESELSPAFYHYLIYYILELKHSEPSSRPPGAVPIGISLDLPATFLNDTAFSRPKPEPDDDVRTTAKQNFVWQQPSDRAVLYFGDTWKELHTYLTYRLAQGPSLALHMVSQKHAAWLESMLDLMRLQGSTVHYPSQTTTEVSLVTYHEENYQIPEERTKKAKKTANDTSLPNRDEPLTADDKIMLRRRRGAESEEKQLSAFKLTSILPDRRHNVTEKKNSYDGQIDDDDVMPIIDFKGDRVSHTQLESQAINYIRDFRRRVGTCTHDRDFEPFMRVEIKDFFCNAGEEYDYFANEESDEAVKDDSRSSDGKKEGPSGSKSRPGIGKGTETETGTGARAGTKDDNDLSESRAASSTKSTKSAETLKKEEKKDDQPLLDQGKKAVATSTSVTLEHSERSTTTTSTSSVTQVSDVASSSPTTSTEKTPADQRKPGW